MEEFDREMCDEGMFENMGEGGAEDCFGLLICKITRIPGSPIYESANKPGNPLAPL